MPLQRWTCLSYLLLSITPPFRRLLRFSQGASADGLESVFMMSEPHPALKAQFLIFCGFTGYEYFYPNGAYRKVMQS